MKPKPYFQKPAGVESSKPQKDNPKASGKHELSDGAADETDLQNLNEKAKGYPFSNYYKANDNDPL